VLIPEVTARSLAKRAFTFKSLVFGFYANISSSKIFKFKSR